MEKAGHDGGLSSPGKKEKLDRRGHAEESGNGRACKGYGLWVGSTAPSAASGAAKRLRGRGPETKTGQLRAGPGREAKSRGGERRSRLSSCPGLPQRGGRAWAVTPDMLLPQDFKPRQQPPHTSSGLPQQQAAAGASLAAARAAVSSLAALSPALFRAHSGLHFVGKGRRRLVQG